MTAPIDLSSLLPARSHVQIQEVCSSIPSGRLVSVDHWQYVPAVRVLEACLMSV